MTLRLLLLLGVCLGATGLQAQAPNLADIQADAALVEGGAGELEDSLQVADDTTNAIVLYDSLGSPAYIARQMRYAVRYDFIDYGRNYIQWQNREVVAPFFRALSQAGTRRVKVVHMGDSHVQADMYPGAARNYLQRVFGRGGRGAMFPYRAAGTHSAYDYNSYSSGLWLYDRNIRPENGFPLGIHGATVRTTDSTATLRFIFNEWAAPEPGNLLKIFCKRDSLAFNLELETEFGNKIWIRLDQPVEDTLLYVAVPLPPGTRDFTIRMLPQDTLRRFFECYGLMLETNADSGLTYYSMGINGATFTSVLNQNLMTAQLTEMRPDLVVLDISGNEYYGRPLKPADFEHKLRTWVQLVQRACPEATVLISCSQDILYRRRYPISATKPASEIAQRVAFEKGCAFYNWYVVAGGEKSIYEWAAHRLVKRDNVHLTYQGYSLKGELLANAILTAYYQYLTGNQSLVDTTRLAVTEAALQYATEAPVLKPTPAETGQAPARNASIPKGYEKVVHTVRRGDVLGAIAEQYHVYVGQIQAWNGLRSHLIYPGQQLVIYVKPGTRVTAPAPVKNASTKTPTKTNPTPGKGRLTYTVRSGDNLWGIAKKYGTTVEAIKRLNGLQSDALRPGQKLQIP